MTISILVLNKDSRKGAIVSVKTQNLKGETTKEYILEGPTYCEVLVHSDQKILIEEVKNGD